MEVIIYLIIILLGYLGALIWLSTTKKVRKTEWFPKYSNCNYGHWGTTLGNANMVIWTWGTLTESGIEDSYFDDGMDYTNHEFEHEGFIATPFLGRAHATCMWWQEGTEFPVPIDFSELDEQVQAKIKNSKKDQTVIYYCNV